MRTAQGRSWGLSDSRLCRRSDRPRSSRSAHRRYPCQWQRRRPSGLMPARRLKSRPRLTCCMMQLSDPPTLHYLRLVDPCESEVRLVAELAQRPHRVQGVDADRLLTGGQIANQGLLRHEGPRWPWECPGEPAAVRLPQTTIPARVPTVSPAIVIEQPVVVARRRAEPRPIACPQIGISVVVAEIVMPPPRPHEQRRQQAVSANAVIRLVGPAGVLPQRLREAHRREQ